MEEAGARYLADDDMDILITPEGDDILEEIEEDEECLTLGKPVIRMTPERTSISPERAADQSPSPNDSPSKVKREFGNISPISELFDENDDSRDVDDFDEDDNSKVDSDSEDVGKVTPEPKPQFQNRASFPRISDGRSSPILAYSPSLIKSPSTKNSQKSTNSPSNVGRRPRNIALARMLDNISDHSSGDEEVNNVGALMAKCSV